MICAAPTRCKVFTATAVGGLLALLLVVAAAGQTLPSRHFSLAEGLPETSVIALAQDGQGRLWVVTEVGPAWYDGHDFHSLTTRSGLPNTRVSALSADPSAVAGVWLGFRDGSLCYFDPATAHAHRVMPSVPGHPAEVRALLARDIGTTRRVWVGTAGGDLYCLGWPTGRGNAYYRTAPVMLRAAPPLRGAAPPTAVNALAAGAAGQLWVGTDHGLRLLDEATGRPLPLPTPLPPALDTGAVLGLNAAADGRLWCSTPTAGLFVLDPSVAGGRVRQYTTAQGLCSNRVLRALAEPGPAGRVWVLTGNGLSFLERATAPRARCLPGTGLVSHSYHRGDLLRDREGNLWANSADGLTQYPPDGRFTLFGPAEGLPGAKVYALAHGKPGEYWVGTNNGLARLYPAEGRYRALPDRPSDVQNIIRSLLVRANGDVWAGATQGGTAVWHPGAAHWQPLSANIPQLAATTVASLAEDDYGRVWMATETSGVIVYDPATARTEQYRGPALAGAQRVMKVLRSHTGTMWLGTEGAGLLEAVATPAATPAGVHRLHFRSIAPQPAGTEPLSIFSMCEDQHGRLWLTSFGQGMFTYDPAHPAGGMRPVKLHDQPGAHVNNPYFVQCDGAGAVWLGTTRGLMRYEPATGQQTFFGREDGFIGQETGINAVLSDPDGTLWAGTVAGVMRYTPTGARPNRVPPNPRLTGVRLFMHDTALQAGSRLPHYLNHLTFDYAATSLTNPSRVRYKFRLTGFESDWNGPLAARSATYTNLPPGNYAFELRAANEAGVWSPRPATFSFAIRPPWWRTWWAYALYCCGVVFLLYGVRAFTRDRERDRADRQLEQQALFHLQELDQVKTNFFTNVSHELRTPLTLILGPAEALAQHPASPLVRQQAELVLRNAHKLLALINQLLDLSKLEEGALRLLPTSGDVVTTVHQLVDSFSSLAESRTITLRYEAPPQPVPLVFDATKVEEIITNLLANALRFTPSGGSVTVTVAETPPVAAAPGGGVAIAIRDTGPGIAAEDLPHLFDRFYQATNPRGDSLRTGTGIGLALVRELTALHGGVVEVVSQPGAGATFTVQLPRVLRPIAEAAVEHADARQQTLAATIPTAVRGDAGSPASVPVLMDAETEIVLIIEDNEEVREFIRATLVPAGYRLLLAADGRTGVRLAQVEVPDLVVSDVMMPGLDGYQVCRQLKTDPATSHIPVVLLTAKSDPGAKLEGLETGADSFLAKPFSPLELQAQVRNLLALRQRVRAHMAAGLASTGVPAAPVRQPLPPPALPDTSADHAAVADLLSLDQEFLRRLTDSINRHLADENFGVDQLGADIGMSRTQVHRKLKALTGQSPGEHIRGTRLHRARALLRAQVGTVAEVSYLVGFGSPAAFSTAFSRQFGYPPSVAARHDDGSPATGPAGTPVEKE